MGFVSQKIIQNWITSDEAREQLIADHLPFVKYLVQRITPHLPNSVATEDLFQAGVIGLIEAVDRYEPDRDSKFSTFAAFRIRGAIFSELRDRDYLSRNTRKKIKLLHEAYLTIEKETGREASDEEVSELLKLESEEFEELKMISNISIVSLEDLGLECCSQDMLENMLGDTDAEEGFSNIFIKEMKEEIAKSIDELGDKEKLVVSLYYWDELNMKEIAKVLDITESRVSQIHSQAISRMKKRLIKKDLLNT